jgi:hypothetical protein
MVATHDEIVANNDTSVTSATNSSEDLILAPATEVGDIMTTQEEVSSLHIPPHREEGGVAGSFTTSSSSTVMSMSPFSSERSSYQDETRPAQRTVNHGPRTTRTRKRKVRFSTIEIRQYEICVGDNPSVRDGVPIAITWTHCNTFSFLVNEYERKRNSDRRPQSKLKMSASVRNKLLIRSGVPEGEIHAGTLDARRSHARREWTKQTLALEPVQIFLEYSLRALVNSTVRRRTRRKERASLFSIRKAELAPQQQQLSRKSYAELAHFTASSHHSDPDVPTH